MTLRLLRCDDVAPQPWKNGGGSTRELWAWPSATSGAPWTLRISVADIASDGPFSAYPGIDRWFAVLQGGGVRLALPDGPCELHAGCAPLAFGGEAAPGCTLLHDATRDLNLMVRRGAGQAAMRLAAGGQSFAPHTRWRALFALDALTLRADGEDGPSTLAMPAWSLAWDEAAPQCAWHIAAAAAAAAPRAYWIHFTPGAA
ncbi:MAG TPA: HutD family protein [Rubrivivax sp.]|nr:HutD family protein [Rubrivivax sp.]HPO19853.1 HutD family protein [Rubrivivax sp.]